MLQYYYKWITIQRINRHSFTNDIYISLFQTGWFLESMWSQILILQMLRTSKIPFIQSNASKPVLITTIIGIILFTGLTFTPFATNLGLTQLPALYFIYL